MAYNHIAKQNNGSIIEAITFTLKRIGKFYALYLITTFLALFINVLFLHKPFGAITIVELIFSLSFIKSYFNGPAWFIVVLVFCYFCTPAIICLVQQCQKKKISILLISVILLTIRFFIEWLFVHYPAYLTYTMHSGNIPRLLEYTLAFIAGTVFYNNTTKDRRTPPPAHTFLTNSILEFIITGTYIASVFIFNTQWYRATFVIAGIILVYILSLERGIISKILSNKIFQALATIELEIYLFHQIIITLITHILLLGKIQTFFLSLALILIISVIWHTGYSHIKIFIEHLKHKTESALNKP